MTLHESLQCLQALDACPELQHQLVLCLKDSEAECCGRLFQSCSQAVTGLHRLSQAATCCNGRCVHVLPS